MQLPSRQAGHIELKVIAGQVDELDNQAPGGAATP